MSITRTTKTIETPNGHKVVVFDYISSGEMRKFQNIFFSKMDENELVEAAKKEGGGTIDQKKLGEKVASKIGGSTLLEAQELLCKLLVVSVDDDKDADVMDLRPADADAVIAELDEMAKPVDSKKKSETPSQPTSPAA